MPYANIQGKRLYWEQRGQRKPSAAVVFLHDGLGSVRSWKDLPERICGDRWEAVLYDRAGYGRSTPVASFEPGYLERESQTLEELLDHWGLATVHLVGHSDGASIALIVAARLPRRLLSLTLIAPHSFVEEEARMGIQQLLKESASEVPGWLRKQQGQRARVLLDEWSSVWLDPVFSQWDIRASLTRIKSPLLVVQGDQDEFGTLAQVEAIEAAVAPTESWIVAGCGHKPHIDKKQDFAKRVVRHIAKATAESR